MATENTLYRRAHKFKREHYDEKKTHNRMALEYLWEYGSITPIEALTAFGCFRLAAVICNLRKAGLDIDTDINKDGKHFAIYTLNKEEN